MNLIQRWISVLSACACAGSVLAAPPQPFELPAAPPDHRLTDEPGMLRAPFTVQFRSPEEDGIQEEGAAWIGVQLGPVPSALASHLGIAEKGLMVRNVFQGSPADKADLQRYDVLVRADDADVVGTVQAFSKSIRSRKPGDPLLLTLMRGGKELQQEIQLAEAPAPEDLEPKFAEEPDVLYRKDFGLRGRILRPGPEGWVMEDLGELPDIEEMLRERGWDEGSPFRRHPDARSGSPDHARRVGKNGETVDVQRQKDGSIEVRREKRTATGPADESGPSRAEVTVYPNMEELRKGDPEAAELLTRQAPPRGGLERRPERRWVQPPSDERMREWRERFFQGPFERRVAPPEADTPPVRFEAQPDGSITVHKRTRGTELSKTYANREEFKQAAPEHYRQFEEMEQSLK